MGNPLIKSFAKDESGAVTVDWVIITAAAAAFAIATAPFLFDTLNNLSGETSKAVDNFGEIWN